MILLDLRLPRIDGLYVLRAIKASEGRNILVVFGDNYFSRSATPLHLV